MSHAVTDQEAIKRNVAMLHIHCKKAEVARGPVGIPARPLAVIAIIPSKEVIHFQINQ